MSPREVVIELRWETSRPLQDVMLDVASALGDAGIEGVAGITGNVYEAAPEPKGQTFVTSNAYLDEHHATKPAAP